MFTNGQSSLSLIVEKKIVLGGQTSDLENVTTNLIKTMDENYNLIRECTGQPSERVAIDCSIDFEMAAKEVLEYGVVEEIVSRHGNR